MRPPRPTTVASLALSLGALACDPEGGLRDLPPLDISLAPPVGEAPPVPPMAPDATADDATPPRTWRVSRDGTGDFTDLRAAVAYARHGDTLRVAPGRWSGPVEIAGKALSILGEGAADETIIDGNGAPAALSMVDAHRVGLTVAHLTLTGSAPLTGDGLRVEDSEIVLTDVIATGNGRGIHLLNTAADLVGCELVGNATTGSGGGLLVEGFKEVTVLNTFIGHNQATVGGGVVLSGGTLRLSQSAVVANGAVRSGGSIFVQTHPAGPSALYVLNSVVAHSVSDVGIYVQDPDVLVDLRGTDLHDHAEGRGGGYFVDPVGRSGNVDVDPGWVGGWPEGVFGPDDLHLRPTSALRDAGWGQERDPDGSAPDIGLFGGPLARVGYYTDADRDGLYDGWELSHGLRVGARDGHLDGDGDSLSNVQELAYGADPGRADTDGDARTDLDELLGGSSPVDAFSPWPVVQVPGQIARLDVAIARAPGGAVLQIAPGTIPAAVSLLGKALTLEGAGPDLTILDGRGLGPTLSLTDGEEDAVVRGLTLTGGAAAKGGGIYAEGSSGVFEDVVVRANLAQTGGGIYARESALDLTRVEVRANAAEGSGGGLFLLGAGLEATDVALIGNTAADGAGLATSQGGILRLIRPVFRDNVASVSGGGVYIIGAPQVSITNALFANNAAQVGGAMDIVDGVVDLERSTLVANRAGTGGGIALSSEHPAVLRDTILAYNLHGGGLWIGGRKGSVPSLEGLLLWANADGDIVDETQGLITLPGSISADPLFVGEPFFGAWSPQTLYLASQSPGILPTPEGAPADQVGLFGGRDAPAFPQEDSDADGLDDGWEVLWVAGLEDLTEGGDGDGDGLSDGEEWRRGLSPIRLDSDGDGVDDGAELMQGSDPRMSDAVTPPRPNALTAEVDARTDPSESEL